MTGGAPLACEVGRRRAVDVRGLRLSFVELGEPGRPPLCLLHGSSAHAHWFDRVAPRLADRFHVIALDQRGHGESGWPRPSAYQPRDFAGDLLGVMEALGWRRMALVGHSMGGHNALWFSAWHPDRLTAAVFADCRPATPPEREAAWRRGSERAERGARRYPSLEAAAAAFRLFPPGTVADRALLHHVARAGITQVDGGFTFRFDPACNATRVRVDAWPVLPAIAVPALVVRGELTRLEPRATHERMRDAIPGASLVEIPGAYHHVPLDAPEAFAEIVGRFVGEAVADTARP